LKVWGNATNQEAGRGGGGKIVDEKTNVGMPEFQGGRGPIAKKKTTLSPQCCCNIKWSECSRKVSVERGKTGYDGT